MWIKHHRHHPFAKNISFHGSSISVIMHCHPYHFYTSAIFPTAWKPSFHVHVCGYDEKELPYTYSQSQLLFLPQWHKCFSLSSKSSLQWLTIQNNTLLHLIVTLEWHWTSQKFIIKYALSKINLLIQTSFPQSNCLFITALNNYHHQNISRQSSFTLHIFHIPILTRMLHFPFHFTLFLVLHLYFFFRRALLEEPWAQHIGPKHLGPTARCLICSKGNTSLVTDWQSRRKEGYFTIQKNFRMWTNCEYN